MKINRSENPLITVVMPVYNAGRDLLCAVKSVVRQTYINWELFIIDDGSTDGCVDSLITQIQDPRIKIIRDGCNCGLMKRLNQAIDLANGELIARMDQDDVSYPNRFERQVQLLVQNPRLDLVAVRSLAVAQNGIPLGYFPYRLSHNEIVSTPWNGFYFPHPTWMGRIEWFRQFKYTTRLSEDQGLLTRSYKSSNFETISEVLFAYRIRDSYNWRLTMLTRYILLKEQIKVFAKEGSIKLIMLAVLAFIAKAIRDFSSRLSNKKSPRVSKICDPASPTDIEIYNRIVASLTE